MITKKKSKTAASLASLARGEGKAPTRPPGTIGRPPRTDPAEKLGLWLNPELREWLKIQSVKEKRTLSAIVEELIREYRQKVEK